MKLIGCRQLAAVAIVAAATACGGDPGASFEPVLTWGECPADVEVTFLSRHECGTLTVLEDRDDPDGATVELLVAKVWPVGVEPRPGIGTGFGADLGDSFAVSGAIATGATRWGRIVVQMEARGSGPHVSPSLRCPEADTLAVRAASTLTGDEAFTAEWLEAVEACSARLRADGIDPADYGVAASAADEEDLRQALGVDSWEGVGTQGTTSRILFEYLRNYPDRVRSAVADSPWFPEVDDLTGGVAATRAALAELFSACAADSICDEAYPQLERTWDAALDRLNDTPLRGATQVASGETVDVVVDAPKLLRAARFALGGDGPLNASQLPSTIAAAADGEATPWILSTIAQDPIFCAGYRPFCVGQDAFSLGVYLTAFCSEQEPFIDDDVLAAAVDGDPVYEAVFINSPYRVACDAWDVEPADPAIVEPLDTDVPLLLLTGQFDSFSPSALADSTAAQLPTAWAIEVPGQTHNGLGFAECVITARNQWRSDPTSPPDSNACETAPSLDFAVEP